MNSIDILPVARSLIYEACDKVKKPELQSKISLELSNRMTSTAGMCRKNRFTKNYTIQLSIPIFKTIPDSECKDTILHEFAHALDNYIYDNWGHSWTWKACCRTVGCPTERCHDYVIAKSKRRERLAAMCGCNNGCLIGPVQAKRLLTQTNTYRCRRCKQQIRMVVKSG